MDTNPEAAAWEGEYDGKVASPMLQLPTTLEDYFRRKLALQSSRPKQRESWEKRRALVEARLGRGDELCVWRDGEGFGSCGGLALVREGEIVHAWLHWFS